MKWHHLGSSTRFPPHRWARRRRRRRPRSTRPAAASTPRSPRRCHQRRGRRGNSGRVSRRRTGESHGRCRPWTGPELELWRTMGFQRTMEISEVGKFPDLGNLWNQGSHCQVNIGALLRLTVKRTCRENVGKMWLSSKRCRSLFSFTQILTFMFTIHAVVAGHNWS